MMGNIGPMEVLVVLIIALVVFGPKRLPDLGHSLGKGIREFKGSVTGESDFGPGRGGAGRVPPGHDPPDRRPDPEPPLSVPRRHPEENQTCQPCAASDQQHSRIR
jgi:sec-independent protein translocase protein TatA